MLRNTLLTLALLPTLALAGTGLSELPGREGDKPVTVFYPTDAADQPLQRGPFNLMLASGATPRRGNGRLVVISHGSGGAAWVHSDLARKLVAAGFVVAVPWHRGDHALDSGKPGPDSWRRRPAEVSRAIDAVAADPGLASLLRLDRVGVFGQSAGGHTALSLAGGTWSPARFLRHCQAHIAQDFNACVGSFTRLDGGWLDGLKQWLALAVLGMKFSDDTPVAYHDARIAAAVAGVPAAADFDPASLAQPRVPLGLVGAAQDAWLAPRWHGDSVRSVCQTCTSVAQVDNAGHNLMLSPLPPREVLDTTVARLLADPPGFDRATVVPEVEQRIVAFFTHHLE